MLHLVLCGITQLHNANFHEIFLFNNAKMKLYGFYKQDQRVHWILRTDLNAYISVMKFEI